MIVNTDIFTCSICGEASKNICAYCTKDACSNHRCARCKRCSDCCECELPLSEDEAATIDTVPELSAEAESADTAPIVERRQMSSIADFLTTEEASVFAQPVEPTAVPEAENSGASGDPEDPHP